MVDEVLDSLDLTALVQERVDIDALVSTVDIVAVVDRMDIDAIVRQVDIDGMLRQVDIDAIVSKVDIDAIVRQVDIDAIARQVDVDAIVSQVDIDAIAKRIDVDAIVERIDIDAIVSRVDVDAIVRRLDLVALAEEVVNGIDLPEIIRESTGSMASDVVRDARMQSIDADVAIARVVDRIIRRRRARRTDAPGEPESLSRAEPPVQPTQPRRSRRYPLSPSRPRTTAAMSTHVDPIPREARPFQGHRAGLVTRTAAAAIDIGIVIVALGVCYLGVTAFLFLFDPRNFTVLTPSPWLVYAAGGLLLIVYLGVSWSGQRPHLWQPRHGVACGQPPGPPATSTRLPRPCGSLRRLSDRAALGVSQWP